MLEDYQNRTLEDRIAHITDLISSCETLPCGMRGSILYNLYLARDQALRMHDEAKRLREMADDLVRSDVESILPETRLRDAHARRRSFRVVSP